MPRPFSVTLLALAVFCLAGFNLLGAVSGFQRYAFLRSLPLGVPPAYLIVSDGVWAAVFVVMGIGLWRLKHWGRVGTLAAFNLYVAQGWLDRLIFNPSDFARVTIPWALGTSVISLALVWGILLRRAARRSFSA